MPERREINAGFWSQLARLVFGIIETEPLGAPREIGASLVLGSERPEWLLLQQERRYGLAFFSVAAGVGNFAVMALVNPAGSGILAVVEEISAREGSGTATWVGLNQQPVDLTGLTLQGTVCGLDSRAPDAAACGVYRRATATNPAAGNFLLGAWKSDNTTTGAPGRPWRRPIILSPGNMLLAFGIDPGTGAAITNNAFYWYIGWREHLLAKAESY